MSIVEIVHCKCRIKVFDLPTLKHGPRQFVKGLCEGVRLGASLLAGFPSLHTIPHTSTLEDFDVKVFQQVSTNQTVVIRLENPYKQILFDELAQVKVGRRIFVGTQRISIVGQYERFLLFADFCKSF